MTTANQLRANWRIMPDRIPTVTCQRQTSPGVYTSGTIKQAWYRHKGTSEAQPSMGGYLVDNYDWYYPKEVNVGLTLNPGDVIQYSGSSYTVGPEGVQLVGAMGAWKVSTLQPRLNAALDDTITIRRYAMVKGDAGLFVRGTATVLYSNLPCKIQDSNTFGVVPESAGSTQGKVQSALIARIFLSQTIRETQPHDEITDQNGLKWTFEADGDVNILGQFMSFNVRRIT